jgi:uncharacterized membrane protein
MRNLRIFIPLLIINILALCLVAAKLPAQVPTHVGPSGAIDDWGSKWIIPFMGLLPVIILISALLYQKQTKQSKTNQTNKRIENILFPFLFLFMIIISWIPAYIGFQYNLPLNQPIDFSYAHIPVVLIGILFIVLGKSMNELQQNRWVGIRTPWTLRNERVWQQTHAFGARYSTLGGTIILVGSVVGYFLNTLWISIGSMLVGVFIAAFVPTIYSYFNYRKITK